MDEGFNSIEMRELLPELFAREKSFSKQDYYNEVIRICPELKKKWYETIPSEKQIQKIVMDYYGDGLVDGKSSIPEAENALGIQIGERYKFPRGMTDLEYAKDHFYRYGLFPKFQTDNGRSSCFQVFKNSDGTEIKKPDKKLAYLQAWRNLHYPDREAVHQSLLKDWEELCELNPQLKNVQFDKSKISSLTMAVAGVKYDFPHKDIEMFVQEYEKGVKNIGKNHNERIMRELKEAGITDFRPHWVPSSSTIQMMGERLREKEAKNKQQDMVALGEVADKSTQNLEQKLATKEGAHTAKLTAQQVAKQKGIIAKAATANAKFDKAVDKAVERGAQALNNTKVGKAYEKTAQVVSETAAAKTVSKTVEKVTQKAAQTAVGKAVTKTVAKTAGSAVGKSVLKKIPLVSLGAGAWFAWDRIKNGDWKGACGELASGALGCLPGVGTAASTAIDVGLAAKDISEVVAENKQTQTSEVSETKTAKVGRAPKNLSKQIEERLNAEKIEQNDSTAVQKLTPTQISFLQKQKQNSA